MNTQKEEQQPRLRSWALWLAVAAFVGMVLQDLGVPITPEKYETYTQAILGLLVLFGIINNPNNKNKF